MKNILLLLFVSFLFSCENQSSASEKEGATTRSSVTIEVNAPDFVNASP